MTHSKLATVAFTAAMLIAAAPALAGNTGSGQVTPRMLLIEELGPKYLLHRGAHWPPVPHIRRIATPRTDQLQRIERLGPKYLLGG
jgi:hypothetical protein